MAETTQSRREREKQARYDSILDAAERVFSEKSYERTSMDDIARTAGLSRALLYVYFKDKAAIHRGIILRAGHSLRRRFEHAVSSADTGLDQARAIGQAYYRFYTEEPDYFSALTTASIAMADADPEEASAMWDCRGQTMGLMVSALQHGIEDGTIDGTKVKSPIETALYLRGSLHGVIMLCQTEMLSVGGDDFSADSLVSHTIERLTGSIAGE